jgi:hypothetical protein
MKNTPDLAVISFLLRGVETWLQQLQFFVSTVLNLAARGLVLSSYILYGQLSLIIAQIIRNDCAATADRGDKLIYVCHYKAKIVGDESQVCSKCLWHNPDVRLFYEFGCEKPDRCTCTICRKQPLSLKSAASEIVLFRL